MSSALIMFPCQKVLSKVPEYLENSMSLSLPNYTGAKSICKDAYNLLNPCVAQGQCRSGIYGAQQASSVSGQHILECPG